MVLPKLQVALDHTDLAEAISMAVLIGEHVDVIEAGTILLLENGNIVVRILREIYPNKLIVADTKCADAGKVIARNCKKSGANIMTCICSADITTIEAASAEVDEIQIELFGNWTSEQAKTWLDIGVNKVIYHQSRDLKESEKSWGDADLKVVKELIEMGFKVSVTGGVKAENLQFFHEIPVDTFIVGRGITEATDPVNAVVRFKKEIERI